MIVVTICTILAGILVLDVDFVASICTIDLHIAADLLVHIYHRMRVSDNNYLL
jgi:hypothetical protein